MNEETNRFNHNIEKLDSIIKDIEAEAVTEKEEDKFKALEKKLSYFQDYKANLETWLSIVKELKR